VPTQEGTQGEPEERDAKESAPRASCGKVKFHNEFSRDKKDEGGNRLAWLG
jgi:hypothetical protein